MDRLKGKVALITGAASGIGEAQARLFISEGAQVVFADVDESAGNVAASLGNAAGFFRHDVGDEASWNAAVSFTERTFGKLNVLVNTAGVFDLMSLADTTTQIHDRQVRVNQLGTLLGIRSVIESMKRAKGGAIVNISSGAGLKGAPGMGAYCATKWAVRGISLTAAAELARHNIRVNAIFPGCIDTPLLRSNPAITPEIIAGMIPGRAGRPEEVAWATLFLASDEASYISGAELSVDGGMMTG